MSAWLVRQEGSDTVFTLPDEAAVMAALRDGNFVPADEVKGPTDTEWKPFDSHPTFAETALDLEPPPIEAADDTHLDMNPLIDVCLVLLIFFILTITYATLERAIGVPEDNAEDKASQKINVNDPDVKDRIFIMTAKMDGEKPVLKLGTQGALREVALENVKTEMENLINTTGRREMILDIERDVPWGVETAILDAASGNKVHNIINNQRGRR